MSRERRRWHAALARNALSVVASAGLGILQLLASFIVAGVSASWPANP